MCVGLKVDEFGKERGKQESDLPLRKVDISFVVYLRSVVNLSDINPDVNLSYIIFGYLKK